MEEQHKKVMEELVRGQNFANQLIDLLGFESLGDQALTRQEDLVTKISDSFKKSLSMLIGCGGTCANYYDGRKSEDSDDSVKSSLHKDRRGCYKRRKGSDSWTRDHSTLIDDGHAWRKYGQKNILDSKHPRSYFRCTHKIDQGCQATKQVQKIEEDPVKYRTTYYGHHTCKKVQKNTHIILDSNSSDSSILLSFDFDHPTATNDYSSKAQETSFFSSAKQESKDDEARRKQSSLSDYLLSSEDLTATFESVFSSDDVWVCL